MDLDKPNREKLERVFRILYNLSPTHDAEAEPSPGGDGWHLIAYGLPITFQQSLMLRWKLGDDPKRVEFDVNCKWKPKQVLWTGKKEIRRGGKEV